MSRIWKEKVVQSRAAVTSQVSRTGLDTIYRAGEANKVGGKGEILTGRRSYLGNFKDYLKFLSKSSSLLNFFFL